MRTDRSVPRQSLHHPVGGVVPGAEAEVLRLAPQVDGGAELVDLLPRDPHRVRAPALGPGESSRQAAERPGKATRIEALSDQQRGHPRRVASQLDVVDPAAAAPLGVEDLLVQQAVGEENRVAHPPPPLVASKSGTAARARRTMTPK